MYRDDSLALKTIVGVLAVMAYGKCIQTFVTVWAQLVINFEALELAVSLTDRTLSRREVLPQSVGILNALIRLTFQTAALATACALTNFVLSLTFPEVYPTARATASLASDIVLSNLYAFSMMGTLNERRHIRSTASCEVGGGLSEVDFRERRVVEDAELQERVLNNLNKREVPSQFSRNTKEMRPSATTGAARRLAKARGSCP
ncbi:hypothetical protein C8R43DRAFT_948638 [Mycena crocata]|nr:hypothetical protein C8R43DRAFT_948638 [Mycena crocata]